VTQITVKRAVEAWNWIHNNAHEEVGTEYHARKCDSDGAPLRTHVYFKNYHDIMRVPESLVDEVMTGVRTNRRKFDTRMFALTAKARERIGQ